MDFGKRTIKVWGEDVQLDVKDGLPIADLSGDMDNVASQMAWWASVWATAEREAAQVEAEYRRWRAQKSLQALEKDEKLAEWKVRSIVEADPKFKSFKDAQAQCQEAIVLSRAVFAAYDKKANQLQSKGAMMRSELDATGMTTRTSEATRAATSESADDDEAGERSLGEDVTDDDREKHQNHVKTLFGKGKK